MLVKPQELDLRNNKTAGILLCVNGLNTLFHGAFSQQTAYVGLANRLKWQPFGVSLACLFNSHLTQASYLYFNDQNIFQFIQFSRRVGYNTQL